VRQAAGICTGTWTGMVHGVAANGALAGSCEPVVRQPGFVPPLPGEHPRLLIRRSGLESLVVVGKIRPEILPL